VDGPLSFIETRKPVGMAVIYSLTTLPEITHANKAITALIGKTDPKRKPKLEGKWIISNGIASTSGHIVIGPIYG